MNKTWAKIPTYLPHRVVLKITKVRDSQNHGDNWGLLRLAAHVRGENTRLRGSSLPAPSLKVIKDVVNGKSGPSFSPPQMFLYYSVLPVMIDMKACL